MDLNHLNLRVRDAVACRDFYCGHFGFEPAYEADGGYFLRNAEGFLLAVTPVAGHGVLPPGFHIGFGLGDGEAVRAAHRRLGAAGVPVGELEVEEGYVTFRGWDPDGTEIEVFWEV